MRRITLAFIILLLALSYGYADGLPAEEAERQAKERQLEKVAERFKAETGFRGEIKINEKTMGVGYLEGKFADIHFSADSDTTAFRQVSNRILDKILPYTLASRNQLSMSRIAVNSGRTTTEYHQVVNGYRVESGGMILITYDAGRYRFSISNGTVELPEEPLGEIVTEAEAYQLALDLYNKTEWFTEKYYISCKKVIAYKSRTIDGISQPYRLCWRISFPHMNYFIDAISKEIYSEKSIILH